MGQQQLLLIVLGVIVVGIAVVVGINLFNANAETSTQDSIVSQGTNIGALFQQYYKKPVSMGGGGNTFDGAEANLFDKLPTNLTTSTDASWAFTSGGSGQGPVVITATPLDADYAAAWTVVTTISPTGISSVVTTN
jgi:hypothetical protein